MSTRLVLPPLVDAGLGLAADVRIPAGWDPDSVAWVHGLCAELITDGQPVGEAFVQALAYVAAARAAVCESEAPG